MKLAGLLLLFSLFAICGFSQDTVTLNAFSAKQYIKGKDTLRYRILYPKPYNNKIAYPVVLVLHGSGERGRDNKKQLAHGGSLFASEAVRSRFPAIVIFPQCPPDSGWRKIESVKDTTSKTGRAFSFAYRDKPTKPAMLVKTVLDSLVKSGKADAERMYVGGLSMGGFGTFDMIERYGNYFAAAFPICGGGDTSRASNFAGSVPLWLFHGDQDLSVDVKYSRQYHVVLKKLGSEVRYSEYPFVGHNSWEKAFAEYGLLPWLFSKKRQTEAVQKNY